MATTSKPFTALICIPGIVFGENHHNPVQHYIDEIIQLYYHDRRVEPYILFSRDQLIEKWRKYTLTKSISDLISSEYRTFEDFATKFSGYSLDADGNAISTLNPLGLFNSHSFYIKKFEAVETVNATYHADDIGIIIDKNGIVYCNADPRSLPNVVIRNVCGGVITREQWLSKAKKFKCLSREEWKQIYDKIFTESECRSIVVIE